MKPIQKWIRAAYVSMTAVLLFLMFTGQAMAEGIADRVAPQTGDRISPTGGRVIAAENTPPVSAPTSISAKAAVLIEATSGRIVFGKNENTRLSMASTTKIMTALVALEQMNPTTRITVTAESVGVEGSSIYLVEGETLTLEDLLYALMLESANDAAETIAIAVAGNVPAFADLMNQKAADLGLTDTKFVNPHGLDADGHYTTAKELALLTRAALQNPDFRRICATERHTIPLHDTDGVRLLLNHNKLLHNYDGCIGVKTGFTKKTGRCLVSAAEREGVTMIAVTLGAPDDWRDHTTMLDYGFSLFESLTLCNRGDYSAPLSLVAGQSEYVMVENKDTLSVILPRNHGEITCIVERRRFDFAPIAAGDTVGRLCFYEVRADGTKRALGEVCLYASYDVEGVTYKKSFGEWLKRLFE